MARANTQWFLVFVFFLGLWSLQAAEGEFLFREQHLTVADGLTASMVKEVFQDSRGFMWAGTVEGLCRFDGIKFKRFEENSFRLREDQTIRFVEDRNRRLWIFNLSTVLQNGVTGYRLNALRIFDLASERFHRFEDLFSGNLPFKEEDVFNVQAAADKTLLFCLKGGRIFRYRSAFQKILEYPQEPYLGVAVEESDSCLWLVIGRRLHRVCKGRFSKAYDLPLIPVSSKLDLSGNLWLKSIPHEKYVHSRDQTIMVKEPGKAPSTYFSARMLDLRLLDNLQTDRLGRVWTIDGEKIQVHDPTGKLFETKPHLFRVLNNQSLPSQLNFDQSNLAWMATDNGIFIFQLLPNPFGQYLTHNRESIRGILLLQEKKLWVNTYSGAKIIDRRLGIIQTLQLENEDQNLGVALDGKGKLWVGSHQPEVIQIDTSTLKSRKYPLKMASSAEPMAIGSCLFPFVLPDGRIWLGTELGLAEFDPESQAFILLCERRNFEMLSGRAVRHFYQNREGIWILTDNGLFLFDRLQEKITRKDLDFPWHNFFHLYEDEQGDFWLASRGGGLIHWQRKNNQVRQFTSARSGLSDDVIYAVYADGPYLWLPSNFGLQCFNRRKGEVVHVFTIRDGLPSDEFNYLAHAQGADGTLYLGTINGLVYFQPHRLLNSVTISGPVALSGYQEFDPRSRQMTDQTENWLNRGVIRLAPKVKAFEMDLALLDYRDVRNNQLIYRLENYDQQWRNVHDGHLFIGYLPPGNYMLRVRGKSSGSIWSPSELQIPIFVQPALYQKAWFNLSIIGGVFLMVIGLFRLRFDHLNNIRIQLEEEVARRVSELEAERRLMAEQNEKLRDLDRTKSKLFAIIGHELRGPAVYFQRLTANIAYLIRKKDYQRIDDIGHRLEEASVGLNQLLSNLLSWGLIENRQLPVRPTTLLLEDLVEEVLEVYRPLAENKHLELNTRVEADLRVFVDATALKIILQNLLSNAIKFTPERGKICLRAWQKNDQVILEVADTGIGMDEKELKTLFQYYKQYRRGTAGETGAGFGLAISRELLEHNGGELSLKSHLGEGTAFFVKLPGANKWKDEQN